MDNCEGTNYFAQMPEYLQMELARRTLAFIRRLQDSEPEIWKQIQAQASAGKS